MTILPRKAVLFFIRHKPLRNNTEEGSVLQWPDGCMDAASQRCTNLVLIWDQSIGQALYFSNNGFLVNAVKLEADLARSVPNIFTRHLLQRKEVVRKLNSVPNHTVPLVYNIPCEKRILGRPPYVKLLVVAASPAAKCCCLPSTLHAMADSIMFADIPAFLI